jgi:integrase
MKRGTKRKKTDQKISKEGNILGQAPALPLKMWKEWLKWILSTAGPKIFFVIFLTGACGLRCGEALALKREDINLEAMIPKLIITGDSKGAKNLQEMCISGSSTST